MTKRTEIQVTTDQAVCLCKLDNLVFSWQPENGKWNVSGERGHEDGYGTFFHKGLIGWGNTLFEAYCDYKIMQACDEADGETPG